VENKRKRKYGKKRKIDISAENTLERFKRKRKLRKMLKNI